MKPLALLLLAGASGAGVILARADDAAEARPSVLDGAYSEAQAIRGQTLYNQHCWNCHGETLAGLDQAPPLVGPQFSGIWAGTTLWALIDRIGTMPPDRPGTLSRAENVDILAYLLWYNGLPIGDGELATGQSALSALTFETPPVGQ